MVFSEFCRSRGFQWYITLGVTIILQVDRACGNKRVFTYLLRKIWLRPAVMRNGTVRLSAHFSWQVTYVLNAMFLMTRVSLFNERRFLVWGELIFQVGWTSSSTALKCLEEFFEDEAVIVWGVSLYCGIMTMGWWLAVVYSLSTWHGYTFWTWNTNLSVFLPRSSV